MLVMAFLNMGLFLALIFLDYAKFEKKNEEIRKGDKGAKQ